MVPHPPFMLRPLCVPRLLSLSTVILPSNRSEDSSFGLSRNSRTREKEKNKASRGPIESVPELRSLHKLPSLVLRRTHSLSSRSLLDPSLPVSALWSGLFCLIWYHIARKKGSTSHRLWAGKSIYLESAIPDSAKERNLDPKTSCGLDLSGLTLIVILTLLWDFPLSQ